MISPSGNFRIFLATQSIDFRKGMDGLAAYVSNNFDLDPFSGAIYVFRSRRADRLKVIVWDGTGLVLVCKRLEAKSFIWPKPDERAFSMTKTQFDALFEGLDWQRVIAPRAHKPSMI